MSDSILFLGMSLPTWLQTGSLIVAAGALIFNAKQVGELKVQNFQSEKKARQRATIDLALHEKSDPAYLECKKKFLELRNDKTINITTYACDVNKHSEQNRIIFAYLDHYEFLATGISEGALDGEIYKKMRRSSVIKDWDAVQPYVYELRKQRNNNKIYCEFEDLVKDWR
ncbi:DUF4760 domain-containing protein [Acinetobacter indicus]|uniref:DUF4760 domain-containing protein n=1 Tax=Acinetobacter indicus TaxID=756892 RepID=UPI000A73C825|nr:DUF4760 domain-containing protein [Acinetobacter indicus]